MSTDSNERANASGRSRNSPFRGLILLTVIVALIAFHAQLLRAAYGLLVVDQPPDQFRYLVLDTPSPECFDAAAELLNQSASSEFLIVEMHPRRSVLVGAHPSKRVVAAEQLSERGISRDRYRVIETDAKTPHQMYRELDQQIASDNATCLVISTSTMSRHCRTVLDQSLGKQRASRYLLRPVPAEPSDPHSWWKSRGGVRRVLNHGLRLVFVICNGESVLDRTDPYAHLVIAR